MVCYLLADLLTSGPDSSYLPQEKNLIRNADLADAATLCAIYNPYVLETCISFEEHAVTVQAMEDRIKKVHDEHLPWLVFEQDGIILGYAYATPWRVRHAYRFSVEMSVYVLRGQGKLGIGQRLYQRLLVMLAAADIHTVIAGIALPNPASIALHEKIGMQQVAHFREVGYKFGQWIDVGYWEMQI